ncbi:MAG: PH domain-containing protein [Clostridiales bacterium]|nr:PH domain-containing protein [Clostridiales bacterium]
MFEKPMRNHFTVIFERLGLVMILPLLFGFSWLQGSLTNIFKPDFWADLGNNVLGANNLFISLAAPLYFLALFLTLASSVLYWIGISFYIKEGFFVFERRTIFRKTAKLPLANIATVNLERNIFQRLVGTAKVKLDLDSAHTANRTDFVLVLPLKKAQGLRDALLEQKEGEDHREGKENDASQTGEIISFSPLSALRHKVLSVPLFQVLMGMTFVFTSLFEEAQAPGQLKGFFILLVFLGLGLIFSLVWGSLNLSDFKLKYDRENFYISAGRFKKVEYTFARRRINALIIKEPLLARIFSLSWLEAAVVGLGNERSETPRLSLLTDTEDLNRLIDEHLPEFGSPAGKAKPSHKAALLAQAFKVFLLCFLVFAFSHLTYSYLWQALALTFIFSAFGGYLAYKTKSLAYYDESLHYSKGIFTKQRAVFKYNDIQDAKIVTNPLMEKLGAGRLNFHILSSSGMKSHKTGWFDLEDLRKISKKIADSTDSSTSLFD